MIDRFADEYAFLSNFYEVPVTYNSLTFKSSEAAFQAQKCTERSKEFTALSASQAKRLGRHVNLRADWEDIKLQEMEKIVTAKFKQNPDLMQKLIFTGDEELIEGNTWHDTYWGVCKGIGENHLGKILMEIREKYSHTKQKHIK